MGAPAGTPKRRGERLWGLAALACVVAAGCAGNDDPSTTTVDAPTTETTIAVLTPDAIPVLQAVAVVPAGTEARDALDGGLIEATTVARADFPVDGVVTIELIEGRRAAADIPAGTILGLTMFTDAVGENATTPAGAGVVSD